MYHSQFADRLGTISTDDLRLVKCRRDAKKLLRVATTGTAPKFQGRVTLTPVNILPFLGQYGPVDQYPQCSHGNGHPLHHGNVS